MNNEDLLITKENNPAGVRFFIKGLINYINAPVFQDEMDEALKKGQIKIILNMSHAEYLCSSGVRVILKTYKEAVKAGGNLAIEEPSEHVKKVLSMLAIDEMLIRP